MTIQIHTNGAIDIDGKPTGLHAVQRAGGTLVYTPEGVANGQEYKVHSMPRKVYTLSTDKPLDGKPGRLELEADVRALLATL